MLFFFFKQKTAYEMRISDWSSDVCSSDLIGGQYRHIGAPVVARDEGAFFGRGRGAARRAFRGTGGGGGARPDRPGTLDFGEARRSSDPRESGGAEPFLRSEEHTSELQSLMRISYAVFCLKKKTEKETP